MAPLSIDGLRKGLVEKYSWALVDYAWKSEKARQEALEAQTYIPENCIITGLEVWENKLFLSTPRLRSGVPSTLNFIYNGEVTGNGTNSPLLIPYPSWAENSLKTTHDDRKENGNGPVHLHSVYAARADPCSRLWALDNGIVNHLTEKRSEYPPAIVVYSLNDNSRIRYHQLKTTEYKTWSSLENLVVDVRGDACEDGHAYMADTRASGLIVYSWRRNVSHRVDHNYFHFDPLSSFVTTSRAYHLHQRNDGLLGLALGTTDHEGYRKLIFHPALSTMEFGVSTQVLQNVSYAEQSTEGFYIIGDRGERMNSAGSHIDLATGIFFYTLTLRNGLACWNTFSGETLNKSNQGFIADADEEMAYPTDVKVDSEGQLWVLSNKMMDYIYRELDPKSRPYRIFSAPAHLAVQGTPCIKLL